MAVEKFITKRIKVTLHDATLLRRGDERRHHFRVSINLSEDGVLTGMPEWIQNCYTLMQKAVNGADDVTSKKTIENMSLGFWATEKTRTKFFSQVNGATVSKFLMQRSGPGDEADVLMKFSIHFAGRREIHEWTYEHKNAAFYLDFEPQQAELPITEAAPPAGEEEDERDRQQRRKEERAAVDAAKGKLTLH